MDTLATKTRNLSPRRGAFAGMVSGLIGASVGDLGGGAGLLRWTTIIVVTLAAAMLLFKFWVCDARGADSGGSELIRR